MPAARADAELKLGKGRGIGIAVEVDGLADGLLDGRAKLEAVPAGKVWRIANDARRQFQWVRDCRRRCRPTRHAVWNLERSADHGVLQVVDDPLPALGKTGRAAK